MASSDAEVVQRVHHAVAASLERWRLTRARRKLVVAVSGGADSLCLLDALTAVTGAARLRLIVGHVDHQLRRASAADAEHVRQLAAVAGLVCRVLTVDVPALAASERRGVEEAARLGRYRALQALAAEYRSAVVATGHTADDSVETTMLHLLRGSGIGGLGGIAEYELLPPAALGVQAASVQSLPLFRPLLSLGRADTVAYCDARGIRYLTDETNADPSMLRNRIRSHLLPVLRTYNPSVDRALHRLAATLSEDERWLDQQVTRAWKRLIARDQHTGELVIELSAWRRQPVALQRRMVRRFAGLAGVQDVGFDAVERALAVGRPDGPPGTELGGGLSARRAGGRLWLRAGAGHHSQISQDEKRRGNDDGG